MTGDILLPSAELGPALDFFVGELDFRIETIFPADEPRVVRLAKGHLDRHP